MLQYLDIKIFIYYRLIIYNRYMGLYVYYILYTTKYIIYVLYMYSNMNKQVYNVLYMSLTKLHNNILMYMYIQHIMIYVYVTLYIIIT